ncbi:MAG: site-specific DNA-methyltransferase, partial [Coriobacteriales bacterium]|nr:site-specific DNA-methyltransferase [Coriobacteriales bacterium]
KLIYIDPPYNTGHDFIYDDDFAQTRAEYEAESGDFDEDGGRLVANLEGNGRFHSDWCSMMYPRLLLARDLLTNDGAIFISIDDTEERNLRNICDEVFGCDCFVANFGWQRTLTKRNDSKGVPSEIEHLIAYSKRSAWQPNKLERLAQTVDGYSSPDGDSTPWASVTLNAPGAATHQGMVYAIQHPITGELMYPPAGRCWTLGQDGMLAGMNAWADYMLEPIEDYERRCEIIGSTNGVPKTIPAIMLHDNTSDTHNAAKEVFRLGSEGIRPWPEFFFTSGGTGGMRRKKYLDPNVGRIMTNFWPSAEVGTTDQGKRQLMDLFGGKAPFDTPKPTSLMRRVLDAGTDRDSVILDFFSGSASMAHAVIQKNAEDGGSRKFILVQIPEEISGDYATLCEVGEERIRRAGAKIAAEVEQANRQLKLGEERKPVPDIGFRVLRIDSSNFRNTYAEPGEQQQASLFDFVDNLKEDRTPEDLLFQVLPAFRIPYSAHIEQFAIGGASCFNVNDGLLIACFDKKVSTDVIEQIAQMRPIYAVFRDASLVDDSAAANFEELFKTYSPDTIRRVI